MVRKIAIKAATVAIALGAMTNVASAETVKLTDAQMDQVTAGVWVTITAPQWVGYLGQNLYVFPGVYWLDPSLTPPAEFVTTFSQPTPTQVTSAPSGMTPATTAALVTAPMGTVAP